MIDPKSLRIGNYSPLFQEIMGAMYEPLHATISQEDAEKAFCDAYIIGVHDGSIAEKKHNYNNIGPNYSKENWLKENGLTPTEPDTKEAGKVIPTNGKVDATND